MATQADVAAHRAAVEDIVSLALAELVAEWLGLPADDPLALRGPLADLLAELVTDFSSMTATLGAEFYESLREKANAPGNFTAILADLPPIEQVKNSAEWASGGAWIDEQKAQRDAAAVVERSLNNASRETVMENVKRDPSRPRWARVAQPDACAFCALMASRGAVYWSEDSASMVGTTTDERRQRQDDKYHDWCGCEPIAVWDIESFELPEYATPWVDAYEEARKELPAFPSVNAVLAHMRANAGLR